jgi:hypothetical protein
MRTGQKTMPSELDSRDTLPHVTGSKKETDEAIKIVDPNQSNLRILANIPPFNRSTFKKKTMATAPTPIMGRLIQKIHLQPECELCANPVEKVRNE